MTLCQGGLGGDKGFTVTGNSCPVCRNLFQGASDWPPRGGSCAGAASDITPMGAEGGTEGPENLVVAAGVESTVGGVRGFGSALSPALPSFALASFALGL